jgi:hypothetical protein
VIAFGNSDVLKCMNTHSAAGDWGWGSFVDVGACWR